MTDNTSVLIEKRDSALWITINRPEKRNAVNADVIAGIAKGYRAAHDDTAVRVIVLTGADKEVMGQTAAKIRGFRPPEPYAGKGVRYQGERVREKAGKAGKAGAACKS